MDASGVSKKRAPTAAKIKESKSYILDSYISYPILYISFNWLELTNQC